MGHEIGEMRDELSKVNVQNTGWALRVIFKTLFGILACLEKVRTEAGNGRDCAIVACPSAQPLVYEDVDE